MHSWTNWSGRQTADPALIVAPADRAGFRDALTEAAARRVPVRAVGASHSHSRVAAVDGVLVDTDRWQGVIDVRRDDGGAVATVRSGTRIHALGPPLHRRGVALVNQGDIDRQSIAGATATGTHGTGPTLGSLSTSVVGLRVLLADGSEVACDPGSEPDLFAVGRQSLGGVGLVTEIDLRVRDRYRLEERQWTADPEDVVADLDRLIAGTRHFEFFWVPDRDRCACKSLAELPAEPGDESLPADDDPDPDTDVELVDKRTRRGWSHRIISSIRDDLHTEMEYAVPADAGPACFAELREMVGSRFSDLFWPIEYRTLAPDDILIGVSRDRPTVTISVHQDVSIDDRPLFEASEEIFRRYDGRPHWGKVHYQTGAELAAIHPGWRHWWELRDRYDPDGRFVTPDLAALRP
ncbi:MAG: D-arabinono-1,4-lactone oxidase [Actinomycetota bacterium]